MTFFDTPSPRFSRNALAGLALAALVPLTACQTSTNPATDLSRIDTAQGSAENINSLSAVIQRTPNEPEAYNMRGAAYGRAGRY
ncbi:MAG: GlcNAc transferase, partial [Nitratireductor sp.]